MEVGCVAKFIAVFFSRSIIPAGEIWMRGALSFKFGQRMMISLDNLKDCARMTLQHTIESGSAGAKAFCLVERELNVASHGNVT